MFFSWFAEYILYKYISVFIPFFEIIFFGFYFLNFVIYRYVFICLNWILYYLNVSISEFVCWIQKLCFVIHVTIYVLDTCQNMERCDFDRRISIYFSVLYIKRHNLCYCEQFPLKRHLSLANEIKIEGTKMYRVINQG